MVGIAGPEGHGLLDFELCMPRKWLEEPEYEDRRKECGVPEDLEFKTKNQLLLELIRKVSASESFQGRYVGVDSAFGMDHAFLDSLPEGLVYFADVPANLLVFPARPDMVAAEWSGRGGKPAERPSLPPKTVKEVIEEPGTPWEDAGPGMGAKGPILTKDKCVKVVEARDGKPGKDVWLCAGKLEDDSIKYALCNESMDASLEMIRKPALTRWSVEQCFKECKDHLGIDHYATRSWTAWRRHMLFTLICQFFITKLRHRFALKDSLPGPVPNILVPVTAQEYREALIQD
jgi:SRSO17 transposase